VRLLATPSTGAQFQPLASAFAIDSRPPAYRLLKLCADGTLTTELVWVEAAGALREPLPSRKSEDPQRQRSAGSEAV